MVDVDAVTELKRQQGAQWKRIEKIDSRVDQHDIMLATLQTRLNGIESLLKVAIGGIVTLLIAVAAQTFAYVLSNLGG